MRARMLTVEAEAPVLVTCGTGGDGSGTVNITTAASFIVGGAGVRVAQDGNRARSSRAGSHDVIEALCIDPAPDPRRAGHCLAEAGLCFMFAPIYHSATKAVAGPRREVGFRTLFNLLGPLTNPAGARLHLNGVFARERCEFLARAHKALGSRRALVVHGGGLDEIAPAGPTQVAELSADGNVRCYEITPGSFGLPEADPAGLNGREPAVNARILREALEGVPGAVRLSALMNAAAGMYVAGAAPDIATAATRAAQAQDTGKALALLERLRALAPAPAKA
jgi:anthranilate phosphoribosyltransferase